MGTNRKEQVTITRQITGHSDLNNTLVIMGKHPTGHYGQCHEERDLEHIVVTYKKYTERKTMITLCKIVQVETSLESGDGKRRKENACLVL